MFDIIFSLILLIHLCWFLALLILIAAFDKGKALFLQIRIGQYGRPFTLFKIRSIHSSNGTISNYGRFLRRSRLDELPQLLNIFLGQMSFVGPRPDVPGYYDALQGESRKILELKPGLFSRAALKYINEESLLAKQKDPMKYNDEIIFPDKVKMNLEYYYNRSFFGDIQIMAVCIKYTFLRFF
ncbi:sugar transferase [Aequorivita flava]|uniref:sugar transferase n=1 Tax=Aequorivita flava TaxID=3114371 RepID=UPI00315EA12F